MSIDGEIDIIFGKIIDKDDDDVHIDVDLQAAADMQEQVALASHFQQMRLSNSCPNCGCEMGDGKRVVLRAGDFSSDVCDLGCAVALFRRKFPNPKNLVSSIEVVGNGARKPW